MHEAMNLQTLLGYRCGGSTGFADKQDAYYALKTDCSRAPVSLFTLVEYPPWEPEQAEMV